MSLHVVLKDKFHHEALQIYCPRFEGIE